MPQIINTNVSSLNSQRQLNRTQTIQTTAMERLSSGLRINSAKDDAAGLGIADRMTSQIRGLDQAVRNANDGISLAQVAEGAMQESTNILQRIRELAVQSANDSNSAADRANLQKEVTQLQSELNRIANTTTFNGKKLLDGSFIGQQFHIGSQANENVTVTIGGATTEILGNERFISNSDTGTINDAIAGTVNNVSTQTLAVAGTLGNADINVQAEDSAKSIADAINAKSEDTGVTAGAITYAQLSGLSLAGTVSFDLYGQNESDPAKVSAAIADTGDLTALANAINDQAGKSGVTAILTDDKTGVVLRNTEGYDITIDTFTHSTAGETLTMTGLDADANAIAAGTPVVLANANPAGTVGGNLLLDSNSGFTVTEATGTNDIAVGATANGSILQKVADIDISSQRGSNDALSVVDGALAKISDARASLGAVQNRFSSTIANLENISQNVSAARSRIQDADFAKESANLARGQILQQAGTAMLAQANASTQSVLTLLQG
ncbi:MAG: flagellin N-terminal helical domain-containing protein [Gammaproteobacteria bacterium]